MPKPKVTPYPVSKPDAGADARTSEPSTSISGCEDEDPADLAKAVPVMPHKTNAASVISTNLFILGLLSVNVLPHESLAANAITKKEN